MLKKLLLLIKSALQADLQGQRYVLFGALIFLLSAILTVLYYVNSPYVELNADTSAYLAAAQQMQQGNPVHSVRLPGYPLLIVLIYALAGQGNLMAVSIVQGALFVLMSVEFYLLTALIVRRGWLAFLIGMLVGSNLILLSYSKFIMTEGFSLWLLTTVALLAVYFMKTRQACILWWMLPVLLLLCFTRPEWILFPILLYGYLLLTALSKEMVRRVLLLLLIIYGMIGGYIGLNALLNGYVGLSSIENLNLLGKVLQYKMYHHAPPEYAELTRRIIQYVEVEKRGRSPYQLIGTAIPELGRNHGKLAGDYARAIILRHPIEFLVQSIPPFFSSLTVYYPPSGIGTYTDVPRPFDGFIQGIFSIHRTLYQINALFPYCALFWIVLLCKKQVRDSVTVRAMALIALIALYALTLTTLGGYYDHDYMRVHIVFDQLIVLVIWGTMSLGMITLIPGLRQGIA